MVATHRDDGAGVRDFRVDLTLVRGALGRLALARAVRNAPAREQLLRVVDAVIDALAEHDAPALHGEACLLRAGASNLSGDMVGAIEALRAATRHFHNAGMELHLASTLRRLGGLLGSDEGDAMIERGELLFAREGVRNVTHWTRMCAPALESAQWVARASVA